MAGQLFDRCSDYSDDVDNGDGGATDPAPPAYDPRWKDVLAGTHPQFRLGRRLFKHLPTQPRCKLCAAPFRGPASHFMRLIGKGPWPKNPKYCGSCFKQMTEHHGGAEIECSLLFADVRGSTPLAEGMRPVEFRGLMERFFDTAAVVLVDHDAIVDKFVGDEVIGIFVPALTGQEHAARAIQAARSLMTATGNDGTAPWVPIGAGVHTGVAFVGSIGSGPHVELTAMGDPVNVAARLASAAGAGEILVTTDAAEAARLDGTGIERRDLALKGKSSLTSVLVLTTQHAG
jgi:adenylate cyclase